MHEFRCNVTSATVYVKKGFLDTVWFDSDAPGPHNGKDAGQFRTRVTEGSGVDYAKAMLGVEPTVVDLDAED